MEEIPPHDENLPSYNTTNEVSSRQSVAPAPFGMKGAQAVFFNGHLYLGGGYTGNASTDAIVLRYHQLSNTWEQLPSSPMKWFGMAVFNQQLVLVGGKEIGCKGYQSTNKIATWDEANHCWNCSLPPMTFARLSPVVYSYKNYLIVGGGEKGSLDYSFEVLDPACKRWIVGPSLPTKCTQHTSVIVGRYWYLLHTESDSLLRADTQSVIQDAIGLQNCCTESHTRTHSKLSKREEVAKEMDPLWKMAIRPHGELVGMTLINEDLFLRVERRGNSKVYIRDEAVHWEKVTSQSDGSLLQLLEIATASL